MQLRPYQTKCVESILESFKEFSKTLIVSPTGSGKTVIMSKVAQLTLPKRTLILAHREELIDQAIQKLHFATGIKADKEKAEARASLSAPVVVASVQTLISQTRLERWPADHFGLVIVDEAHHAISDSYRRVLARFDEHANILGVTATPDRGDKKNLGEYFENIAYELGLFDLIRDGYLSPIAVKSVPLQIDLNGVRQTAGDFNDADLGSALEPYLGQIAQAITSEASFRKTLAFLPLRATSRKFVEACQAVGLSACHVDGESEDRKEILARFSAGEFDVLSNAMLLTEGYDEPSCDCVCVLRPTRSRPLYCLDMETEVLTERGWSKSCLEGESVFGFDLKTGTINQCSVLESIKRPIEKDEFFVSLKSQSVDIRVTNKHRMIYDHKRKTGWKIKTAEDLATLKDTNYIPVAGQWSKPGVPLNDSELRFIGWVMTDGCINKVNGAISITQAKHQPWIDKIEECIKGCGLKFTRSEYYRNTQFNQNSPCVRWTISKGKPRLRDKHLRGWGHLEPWLEKSFSVRLFDCSPSQFETLLEAIHLGDGAKQTSAKGWTRRSYHISSANDLFVERLQIACVMNGWRCNVARHKNQYGGIWILHIKKQNWSRVGGSGKDRPAWVIEKNSNEDCWCVETDLGTIITRRRGKIAILGNCQMVGRGTRLHPTKENLLLLDFLWMHEKLSISKPAHLIAKSKEEADAITELANERAGYGEQELDLDMLATDATSKREEALRRKLEEQAKKKAKYISAEAFAANHNDLALAEYEPTMRWESEAISDKQRFHLKRQGIDPETVKGKGHASRLLSLAFSNQKLQLASPSVLAMVKRMPHIARAVGITDLDAVTSRQGAAFFAELSKRKSAKNSQLQTIVRKLPFFSC